MNALINMAGITVGRWTVVSYVPRSRTWLCKCACGTERNVSAPALRNGSTQSCGCLRNELLTSHGHNRKKHRTPTYQSWYAMLQRCTNEKHKQYRDYGRRGITVCHEWNSFPAFLADMGERPVRMTLERIDNATGYSKSNCKWATRSEQQLNRRTNRMIEFRGASKPLTAWAREVGKTPDNVRNRIRMGWSVERALTVA